MLYIYGLILTTVVSLVLAQSPEELRNKIKETKQKTKLTLDKIKNLEADFKDTKEEYEQRVKTISIENENLTKEENDLINEMLRLNISITTLEVVKKLKSDKLRITLDQYYRFKFIIKLLEEDLGVLIHRREIGDERNCYEFQHNKTTLFKNPENLQARGLGVRGLGTTERITMILKQQLRQAKAELSQAESDLKLLEETVITQKTFFESQLASFTSVHRELSENVKEGNKVLEELRKNLETLKREETFLHEEMQQKKKSHENLRNEILRLRNRIQRDFRKPRECYKELMQEPFYQQA